jgi:hypothetical protein
MDASDFYTRMTRRKALLRDMESATKYKSLSSTSTMRQGVSGSLLMRIRPTKRYPHPLLKDGVVQFVLTHMSATQKLGIHALSITAHGVWSVEWIFSLGMAKSPVVLFMFTIYDQSPKSERFINWTLCATFARSVQTAML